MRLEQILTRAFENSPDALLLMRDDGIAIDCNPATVRLFGCASKADIIGYHASKFWPQYQPDGRRSVDVAEIIFRQVKSEGSLSFEWFHQCADGTPLHLEALLTAIELDGQQIFHVNWRDISRHREAEEALAYRRALENLITTISGKFINLPTDEIQHGIQSALADLGAFVGADRSYIFVYLDKHMHNLYEWCATGITPQIERMQAIPNNVMRWSNEQLMRGDILNIPCVADLPPAAHTEQSEFTIQGILSVLAVPMERRGQVVGFMGFDAVHNERHWNEEVIDLLRMAAGIIGNVLDRREAELELRETNALLENRVRERTKQLEQRRRVAEGLRETLSIINSNQVLYDTLDHLIEQATIVMQADAGTLYSLDIQAKCGRLEASFNVLEDDVRRTGFDLESTPGQEALTIIANRVPAIMRWDETVIEAIRSDKNVPEHIYQLRLMVVEKFKGSVSVPIFVRDEPFGVLLLYYADVQKLVELDFAPAAILADQAALAIENARLHQSTREKHAEAEQRRRIAEGLREGLAVLNSDQSLDDILEFVVRQAVTLLDTDGGALYLLDKRKKILHVGASYGLKATYTALEIPVGGAITGRAVALGAPVSLPDMQAASDLLQTYVTEPDMPHGWVAALKQLKRDYNAVISIPIRTRNEIYGAMTLYYVKSQQFTDELIALADAFAGQTALVIENARLRERVRETAAIEERNRLARDLHDAVTQTLFSASMIADTLPDLWDIDRSDAQQQLKLLVQLTRGALAEMRSLLIELRPARLLEADIQTLLQQLIDAMQGRSKVKIALSTQGNCHLPGDVKITVYRVAQEALNNIMKHANAKNAFVSLRCDAHIVTLQVLDDGQGFDIKTTGLNHFGVHIMQERATSIGATFILDTYPGEGTDIQMIWRQHDRKH